MKRKRYRFIPPDKARAAVHGGFYQHAPDVRADRLGHFAHNGVLAHDLVLVEVRGSLT